MSFLQRPVELICKWVTRGGGMPPEVEADFGAGPPSAGEATPDPTEGLVERALRQLSKGNDAISIGAAARTERQCYAVLPSRKQPRYLLPLGNPRCAVNGLSMATPSLLWGRILSRMLAGLVNAGWKGWLGDKVVIADGELRTLTKLTQEVTGEATPVFAVFLGRIGRYRKLTVQAMSPSGEVLGYVKLPITGIAERRIRHEAAVLQRLGEFAALGGHIPKVLYAGEWQGEYVLFQSPGSGKPGPTSFGESHRRFLRELSDVHRTEESGKGLVEEVTKRCEQAAPLLTAEQRYLIEAVLDQAATLLAGAAVRCGWTHGDFVASNTLLESSGELFVLDWEHAEFGRPTVWDSFNFQAVTADIRGESEFPIDWGELDLSNPQTKTGMALLFLVDSILMLAQEGRVGRKSAIECRQKWLAHLVGHSPQ